MEGQGGTPDPMNAPDHTNLPIIPVVAGIVCKNGHILIAQRPSDHDLADCWEFPGGKIEPGETPAQCLARELEEELAIQIQVGAELGRSRHHQGHRIIDLLAIHARWTGGTVNPTEHQAVAWIPPGDLPNYTFAPADRDFVAKILTGEWSL